MLGCCLLARSSMTKSWGSGKNDITEEAKRQASRTKKSVPEILAAMLRDAKATSDAKRVRRIIQAQKYIGYRNKRKRSSD